MPHVTVRCHDELNDFLPRDRRHTVIAVPCTGHESIKNLVEALGAPHPEIAALLVGGEPVDLSYQVRPDDQIDVYPASSAPPNSSPLRPALLDFRFVLDTHLGRLAAYLRMLGFDTLYRNDYDDPELAQLAHDDRRVLLTRDIGLLKRSLVIYGYFVRATAPGHQLNEVVRRFDLYSAVASFQRCIRCNGLTQPVEKDAITHLLEPKTRQYYHDFLLCRSCGQIYWQGSHYGRMRQVIERVLRREKD
jgi:uncharacterized protein with PIN domain